MKTSVKNLNGEKNFDLRHQQFNKGDILVLNEVVEIVNSKELVEAKRKLKVKYLI